MKKVLLILLSTTVIFLFWCESRVIENNTSLIQKENTQEYNYQYQSRISAEKIQIYHFHGTNQCRSCITLWELTQKTLDEYFLEELKSWKITYEHINAELQENFDLVQKFQVRNISLFINVIFWDQESHQEQAQLRRYITNEEQFKNTLKEKINWLLWT